MSELDRLKPLFRGLLDYWEEKRAGRSLPAKGEIDPLEIGAAALPHLILTECVGAGAYRYRLVGTEVVRRIGFDPTGRLVADVLSGTYLDYILGMLQELDRHHRPVWSASVFRWSENENLTTERLFLPLADGSGRLGFILGIQQFEFAPKGSVQPTWGVVTSNGLTEIGRHMFSAPAA